MASTINPPASMKAWTYTQTGSYRKVLSMTSIPTPKPRDDEVLIKIAYSGLNPGDVKVMTMIPNFMRPKIAIPAIDYSGHIVALGPHAPKDLTPGMPVFGQVDTEAMFKGTGTLAEYVSISVSKNMIAPLPENVSLEGAGGLAIGGTMAYCTIQQGSIRPDCGLRILINGASGGCGSAFVQAAKAMGAKEIVATCSAPNFDLVSSLGADRVIDYRERASLPDYLAKEYGARPFDVVYDTVGLQELYTKSPGYLKENGIFLNIGDFTHGTMFTLWYWLINTIWPTWLGGTPRKYVLVRGKTGPEATRWVVENAREGTLKPVIDRAMAFDQVLEAFDIVDSRRARGRVVVRVAE